MLRSATLESSEITLSVFVGPWTGTGKVRGQMLKALSDIVCESALIKVTAKRPDDGKFQIERGKVEPLLIPPEVDDASLQLPASDRDVRDVRCHIGLDPAIRTLTGAIGVALG